MLIDFKNKYFTLVAIFFGIYLVHSNKDRLHYNNDAFQNLNVKETARYVVEIDPNKKEEDRALWEKMLYSYAMEKRNESPKYTPSPIKDMPSPSIPILDNITIQNGDKVIVKMRRDSKPWKEVSSSSITVGEGLVKEIIEASLLGMKVEETKFINYPHENGEVISYELKVISLLPKAREK